MLTSEQISPDKIAADYTSAFTETLGCVQAAVLQDGLVLFTCENGRLAVGGLRTGIIRVKLLAGAGPGDPIPMHTTAAVIREETNPGGREAEPKLRDTGLSYMIETAGMMVEVVKQDSSLRFLNESGQILAHNPLLAWKEDKAATALFQAAENTHYYGLGEKTGFLDKRGERYEMWNSDNFSPHVPEIEALYQSIPFLIVIEPGNAYGIFLDNPGRSVFDMRASEQAFTVQTETGGVDYYFIAGPKIKDVVGRYTALTGRIQLPPRWSVGYHQSRYSYMDQEEVLELARTFREKEIPCDVIHLDIHYMDEYRVFTFDPVRFPDPKAMIAELKSLGIRIVPIVDPGVKLDPDYYVYREGAESDFFCMKPDGSPFTGPVWPGQSVFPDFTEAKVREWWGSLHRFFAEMGIEGIWNDMNEPSVFNECKTIDPDALHGNDGHPATHQEIHNLYGMMMSKATAEGMANQLGGRRPFVLSRAGYAGIQRYAAVWTGDNRSYWEHMALAMPMVLNLGLSGIAFAGPDIGGFGHHTTGELLARWTQMGALFPFCRNHSMLDTVRQEPWSFGTEVEDICREYINLRYALMPLIFSVFREAAETGMPVIRPLLLEYPDDSNTVNLCDQFLLGDQVLAAPVYRPDTYHRVVYLPEGNWFDYWTGERREGGAHIMAHAPLDTLPLYVKEGAIIPRTAPAASTEFLCSEELLLDIYTPENGEGSFDLYDDDGTTYAFKDGSCNLHRLTVEGTEESVTLRVHPACLGYDGGWKKWTVTFKHLGFAGCRLDFGTEASGREELEALDQGWHFDSTAGELTVVMEQPSEDVELVVRGL
ncbi:alpha-glucosidase [Paenibacillus forsythiae]|uniref:Alpha-glucosidase n=1 Tax=Paenibacillus forsythiae TaxID=365616 RepID=A0ABU3H482_9BACL|nr:TIM-barrel domain-containing protein [Paenibacillus forsythiae]MDT3425555.1 alpha-glucosidase [Paenibacillus forsythiae]